MSKKYLIIGAIVFFFIILVLGALLSSGGTPKTSNEQIELVWWKPFETTNNLQPLIDAYTAVHKNVRIQPVTKDINNYEKELIDAIASGKGPDIFSIHNDWLPNHIEKMAPAPGVTQRQYQDTFLDVASADFVEDGKIYAMPLSVDVLALYYNKDILNSVGISEPPKTWVEVVSAVQKITSQQKNGDFIHSGIAMGAASNVNRGVDILSLLMLQNGTEFYNEQGDPSLDKRLPGTGNDTYFPASKALEYFTQFTNPGLVSYTWNSRSDNSVDAFSQNKLGMMISYSYMRDRIIDKAPNLNWDVAPVPQPDLVNPKVNFANYWGEAVSKTSTKQAAAWDFLQFITQKDVLQKYYAVHKLPASRKDTITEQFSDLDIGHFAQNAPSSKSVRKQDANEFEGIFIKMIEDVVLRNVSPDTAVQNANQQLRLIPK